MARGGSSKKVARAARAGGGRVRGAGQRSFLFPAAIGLIVVLGTALIVFARDDRRAATAIPPQLGDHWHVAYGFYTCNEFQPDLPEFENPEGIHTHGDGVIHIHPFSANATGRNATMDVFLEVTDIELESESLTFGGETYETGEGECDGKPGKLVIAKWDRAQDPEEEVELLEDPGAEIRFRRDGEAYTIAFVAEDLPDDEIPRPPSAANLIELGAVDAGPQPVDEAPDTTVSTDEGTDEGTDDSSSTTAATSSTTTTAAP